MHADIDLKHSIMNKNLLFCGIKDRNNTYVDCIKVKHKNKAKKGVMRSFNKLEIVHIDICVFL